MACFQTYLTQHTDRWHMLWPPLPIMVAFGHLRGANPNSSGSVQASIAKNSNLNTPQGQQRRWEQPLKALLPCGRQASAALFNIAGSVSLTTGKQTNSTGSEFHGCLKINIKSTSPAIFIPVSGCWVLPTRTLTLMQLIYIGEAFWHLWALCH